MTIAKILRRKMVQYFGLPRAERRSLRAVIGHLEAKLPETVIFGGMLREFALGKVRHFVSDIDLVCDATSDQIANALAGYPVTRNRFGGFRFIVDRRRFDIWALPDTWAFREGHVALPATFDALLDTSFFNLDAAYFHLGTRQVVTHPQYDSWMNCRLLEVNLERNPHPEQMVRRTLDLVLRHQLAVGPKLLNFVGRFGLPEGVSWEQTAIYENMVAFASTHQDETFNFSPQVELLPGSPSM